MTKDNAVGSRRFGGFYFAALFVALGLLGCGGGGGSDIPPIGRSGAALPSVMAVLDTIPPSVPTGLSASAVSSSQINLSWSASTDNVAVTGYSVRINGFPLITLGNVTTYQDLGLAPKTTYSYTVGALDAAGNASAQSTPASATTLASTDITPPSIPTGLSASAVSSTQIDLSWSASTDDVGVTAYQIYRGGTPLALLGNVTTYQDTGLTPSTTYSYTVQALDAAGNASLQSTAASATTQAPGSIAVSLIASRRSGVAPLAVFFDATGSTSTATTRPFHDLEYRWDFGDTGSGTWNTGSKPGASSRNSATGPVAAHVFETPGTYAVNMSAYDGVTTSAATPITITVTDPNTVYSTTNTICFSGMSIFTGCPAGATTVTQSNFQTIASTYLATGKRLLLHRGERFTTAAAGAVLNVTGPWTIGAYGSGALPKLQSSATAPSSVFMFVGVSGGSGKSDGRLMDLELDGQSNANVGGIFSLGGFDQITMLRLFIHDTFTAINFPPDQVGSTHIYDQLSIVDSTIQRITTGAGAYISATQLSFLGNLVDDTTRGEHPVRVAYGDRFVISNNSIDKAADAGGPAGSKETLTIRAPNSSTIVTSVGWLPNTFPPSGVAVTQKGVVSDNDLSVRGYMGISVIPPNSTQDSRIQDVILERNWYHTTVGSSGVEVHANSITVRDEVIDISGVNYSSGIVLDGATPARPASNNFYVYNNTIYTSTNSSNGAFNAIILAPGTSNVTVKNNLFWGPLTTVGGVIINTRVNGYTASNNTTDAQSHGTNPLFISVTPFTPANAKPTAGSYAIGGGTSVPVWSDSFRVVQPAPRDLGAVNH